MTMFVTMTKSGRSDPFGRPLLVGVTYGLDDSYALSLISAQYATLFSSVAVLPTYLGPVATGTFIYDSVHASNTYDYYRSPHFAMQAYNALNPVQVEWANWRVPTGGGVETNGGSDHTITATIEYPAGTLTPLLFGGKEIGTCGAGDNVLSDFLSITIPQGAQYWVHGYKIYNGAGRVQFFQYYGGDGTAKYLYGTTAAAVPDLTRGGTSVTPTTAAAACVQPYSGPCSILGLTSRATLGICGDSNSVGRGDTGDVSARQGIFARAFGGAYAYQHVGVSGDTTTGFIASSTKRRVLLNRCSNILINYGINEVNGGMIPATVLSQTNTVIGYFSTKKVAVCTLGPVTTGTWDDAAGQTVTANEPNRLVVNAQRRNGLTAASFIYDIERPIESSLYSGKFGYIPGTITPATAPFTPDGVHYNRTCCLTAANAMNVEAFMSV